MLQDTFQHLQNMYVTRVLVYSHAQCAHVLLQARQHIECCNTEFAQCDYF